MFDAVLFLLGFIMIFISICLLYLAYRVVLNTAKRYEELLGEMQELMNENYKLQHEVYRLTYEVPDID